MRSDLNLRHLEYFVQTAKIGSINKAAQALYISQPHLGKIIREMEDWFGAPLFSRSTRGVTLTPEGRKVLELAVNILDKMDSIQLQPFRERESAQNLSVSMTRFSHILESFVEVVKAHSGDPSFEHRLYEGTTDDVIEDVLSGRSDVGVFQILRNQHDRAVREMTSRGLTYSVLASVEPHIVLSKNHPLLVQGLPVNLQTLSGYGFIRYLGQYDDLLEDLFSAAGVTPSRIVHVTARSAVLTLISETDFYSAGIYNFDGQNKYNAVSVPVSIPGWEQDLSFEFAYTTLKGFPVSGIDQEFITAVRQRIY